MGSEERSRIHKRSGEAIELTSSNGRGSKPEIEPVGEVGREEDKGKEDSTLVLLISPLRAESAGEFLPQDGPGPSGAQLIPDIDYRELNI